MSKLKILLISLTICLSSCTTSNVLQIAVPERPELPYTLWTSNTDGVYCTDEAGARNILKREAIRDGYEQQLRVIIDEANKALMEE